MAIFALRRRAHFAAHVMDDEVQPVADTEHRQTHIKQPRIGLGRVRVVDRGRAARQNNSNRLVGLDLGQGSRTGQYDGEDILFANAPRYQLRILRAEIKDDDCLGVHVPVWQGDRSPVKNRIFPRFAGQRKNPHRTEDAGHAHTARPAFLFDEICQ